MLWNKNSWINVVNDIDLSFNWLTLPPLKKKLNNKIKIVYINFNWMCVIEIKTFTIILSCKHKHKHLCTFIHACIHTYVHTVGMCKYMNDTFWKNFKYCFILITGTLWSTLTLLTTFPFKFFSKVWHILLINNKLNKINKDSVFWHNQYEIGIHAYMI